MKATIIRRGERAAYDGIQRESWSRIRHLLKSPRHYLHAIDHPEDKPAFALGDAVHVLSLEPDRAVGRFAVWTEGRRAGKAWEAFEAAALAEGRRVLTADEHATAQAIAGAVRADRTAAQYLTGGEAELSILWEACGVPLKSRLDYVSPAGLVELKTTRDASLDGWGREVARYHYATQLAMYSDAWEMATGQRPPVVMIAVENEPPHVVQVYRLHEVDLECGRREYRNLLQQLALCRATNDWGGYAAGEVMLSLPRWAWPAEDAA